MRPFIIYIFLLSTHVLIAQNFTESDNAFGGVSSSSVFFTDVNGDYYPDLFISGSSPTDLFARLYINDSMGNFIEVTDTPFEGVQGSPGCVAFADIDGDDDQDVLITGQNITPARISKLYTNDGFGNYTEVADTPFEGVYSGSVAFADVDGDDDQDLFIIGRISSNLPPIAKLYLNDGSGDFTEEIGTPFEGTLGSSIVFVDVDNDNDLDLLLSGHTHFGPLITKLFTNDGVGNFTEVLGTPFVNIENGCIAFADIDGDNDQDILISGRDISQSLHTKLYTNDGIGNFTEIINTPFEGLVFNSLAFADVDGDDDQDLLITGRNATGSGVSKLFQNDGTGKFSQLMGLPFEKVSNSAIAFSDVDGDNDEDLMITGWNNSQGIAILYINGDVTSSVDNHEIKSNHSFKIYPNPVVSNLLRIDIDAEENSQVQIEIFDELGNLVNQQKEYLVIGENSFMLSIQKLNKGIYFIHMNNEKYTLVQKLLIP